MTAFILLAVAVALRAATVLMATYFLRGVKHRLPWILLVGSLAVTTLDLELRLMGHEGEDLSAPHRLHDALVPLASSVLLLLATIQGGRLIRRESRLRGYDTRYRLLFENLPTAFAYHQIVTDADGQPVDYIFLEVNPAFEKQTGLHREDIIGCRVTEVVPGIRESARDWIGDYGRVALHGSTLGFEDYSEGLNRWYTVSAYSPEPGHFVTIFLDITDRKLAAEKLQQTEEQLRQSQKMEAVGRLAGGVAHDFNNLLTVILGRVGVLQQLLGDGHPGTEHVAEVKHAGERAAALTRQLLTFSRKQVVLPVPVVLNQLIFNLEKMLRRLINEDIIFRFRCDPALGLVSIDPGQMEQVIMNLAINARDAMPNGGTLTIETANVDLDLTFANSHFESHPGPHIQVVVSDTGCGMDTETKARIFEPFFTTKAPDRGTGLGLSIVYGIVKQAGGSIWVYSEPGEGTSFKIYLPRLEQTAERKHVPADDDRSLEGTETILLAEDDDSVRRIITVILEQKGYHVLACDSGERAMDVARTHPGAIDLLMTDLVMPRINGRELSDAVALLRPNVRLLFISGYTDDVVDQKLILRKHARFLQKPFSVEDVIESVRQILDEPRPTDQKQVLV